jgi:hypothetical protein
MVSILTFGIKTLEQGYNLVSISPSLRLTENICLHYPTNLYNNQLLRVEKPFDINRE